MFVEYVTELLPKFLELFVQVLLLFLFIIFLIFIFPSRKLKDDNLLKKYMPKIINKFKSSVKSKLINNQFKFDVKCYKYRYMDLKNMTDNEALNHWNNYGINEFRNGSCNNDYINPKGADKAINSIFNAKCYKERYTQLTDLADESATNHWIKYGRGENRNGSCNDKLNNVYGKDKYIRSIIPIEKRNTLNKIKNFLPSIFNSKEVNATLNVKCYKYRYIDLKNMTDNEALNHWNHYGKYEFRNGTCNDDYVNPKGADKAITLIFNAKCYKYRYTQLTDGSDESVTNHWIKYGRGENRNGSCNDKWNNKFGKDLYFTSIIPIKQRKKETNLSSLLNMF